LYQITLGTKQAPIDAEKIAKWDNKNDEAHGLIRMSVSLDLRSHLQGIDDPNVDWAKLEVVFGKHNVIRAHQIKKQLMTLSSMTLLTLKIIYLRSKHFDF
jgi:hypothetical protein